MKLFNSLEELWNYCAFCPACQNNSRRVYIFFTSVKFSNWLSYTKNQEILELWHDNKVSSEFIYTINCLTGKFERINNTLINHDFDNCLEYFKFDSVCKIHKHRTITNAIIPDYSVHEVRDFSIHVEYFYYSLKNERLSVYMDYKNNITRIDVDDRIILKIDSILGLEDYSNDSALDKIKALLVFQ